MLGAFNANSAVSIGHQRKAGNGRQLKSHNGSVKVASTHADLPQLAPSDGRSDSIHTTLPHGAFVMPADAVSTLGRGSTDAGVHALNGFSPHAGGMPRKLKASLPMAGLADGGVPPQATGPMQSAPPAPPFGAHPSGAFAPPGGLAMPPSAPPPPPPMSRPANGALTMTPPVPERAPVQPPTPPGQPMGQPPQAMGLPGGAFNGPQGSAQSSMFANQPVHHGHHHHHGHVPHLADGGAFAGAPQPVAQAPGAPTPFAASTAPFASAAPFAPPSPGGAFHGSPAPTSGQNPAHLPPTPPAPAPVAAAPAPAAPSAFDPGAPYPFLRPPVQQHFADGGQAQPGQNLRGVPPGHAPVALSQGEYVFHPHRVAALGGGDLQAGTDKLQALANRLRLANAGR